MVARSRISLAKEMRERIQKGTAQDSHWADIVFRIGKRPRKRNRPRRSNLPATSEFVGDERHPTNTGGHSGGLWYQMILT